MKAADFSSEALEAPRKWCDTFQVPEENTCELGVLFLVQISSRNGGEIKALVATTPTVKEWPKKVL